jgi:hypothetical protein
MRLRPVVVFLASGLLAGCASSEVSLNGNESHIVTCAPAASVWAQCNRRAEEICGPKGFSVLKRVKEEGTLVTVDRNGPAVSPAKSRMMVVRCKA